MTSGHGHTSSHQPHGDHIRHRRHTTGLLVKTTAFPVTFRYQAPHAKAVSVTGTFHHGMRHPMRRAVDGYWHVMIELKRGRYEYHFLVDGEATLDPKSFGTVSHPDGSKSSLLEVGY